MLSKTCSQRSLACCLALDRKVHVDGTYRVSAGSAMYTMSCTLYALMRGVGHPGLKHCVVQYKVPDVTTLSELYS